MSRDPSGLRLSPERADGGTQSSKNAIRPPGDAPLHGSDPPGNAKSVNKDTITEEEGEHFAPSMLELLQRNSSSREQQAPTVLSASMPENYQQVDLDVSVLSTFGAEDRSDKPSLQDCPVTSSSNI